MFELSLLGIVISVIVLAVMIVMVVFLLRQNKTITMMQIEAKHKEEMQKSEMSNIIQGKLDDLNRRINEDLVRFNDMITKNTTDHLSKIQSGINSTLYKNMETTEKMMTSIAERMVKIDEAQKNLRELSGELVSLQDILKDKKTRGTFGEIELYSLLKDAFGDNEMFWKKQYELSNKAKADAVLFAPEPLGKIVIDSKFPLENYNRIYDQNSSKDEQIKAKRAFKADVIKHIDDIASKYLIEGETAPVAYMFIPAEAVFAEIYGHYTDVVNYSYERHVYLVSPTTLMAYLTAIKAIYLGQKRNEKVKEMQVEFNKLAIEFDRFKGRYEKVYRNFETTYNAFHDLDTTTNKIVRRFKEISDVKLEEERQLEHDE